MTAKRRPGRNRPMSSNRITYAQLLETNNLIQTIGDETYWLCVTRTVQESKLFPVPAYMMLSYMMAYFRYPSLLRKIESRMSAEEIGDRARNAGIKIQNPSMGWALPGFYLLGREMADQPGPDPAAGRARGPHLCHGFLETLPALLAPQQRPHHQQGIRPPRAVPARAARCRCSTPTCIDCEAGDELHEAAPASSWPRPRNTAS